VKSNNGEETERLPYCQYAGTAVIPISAIGMAMDFRVEYWDVAVRITWAIIFICYALQILYAARLLELLMPTEVKREERTGNMWWPQHFGWKVPASFQHVYYFVAPPPRIAPERGQCDVVRELKEGYYAKGAEGGRKDQDVMVFTPPVTALEEYFQWMFKVAWSQLQPRSQDKVRNLYLRFTEARNSGKGMTNELANELGHIEAELRGIEKAECPEMSRSKADGYGSDSGSASGSDHSGSGYSSGGSGGKSDSSGGYAKDTQRRHPDGPGFARVSYAEPWKLVSILAVTFLVAWVFLFFTMMVDCAIGVQGLVTAPHWAKPPMSRSSYYPWEYGTPIGLQKQFSGQTAWTPEELFWHENHKPRPQGWKPHWVDVEHDDRRLAASSARLAAGMGKEGLKQAFNSLVSSLPTTSELATELLRRVPTKEEATALTNLESRFRHAGNGWKPQAFTWPGFFEPKMLACTAGKDGVHFALSISSRGVVASAQIGGGSETEQMMLTGLSNYPPLLAASWTSGPKEGLMLVTKAGDLLHCAGVHNGKQWPCAPLVDAPSRLPLADGVRLAAAAASWLGDAGSPRLHVATISESSPDVVALWVLDGNTEAASWLPFGEIPVPSMMSTGASLHFVNNGDILLATPDGATIQRRVSDGAILTSSPALSIDAEERKTLQWQAACGLHGPNRGVAHLAMRTQASARHPEVMIMRMMPIND